jgi:hypothetical protein
MPHALECPDPLTRAIHQAIDQAMASLHTTMFLSVTAEDL